MARKSFEQIARSLGFDLNEAQLHAFAQYRDRMLETATRFNLTGVRDPEEIERRHFLESLALGQELLRLGAIQSLGSFRAIDIGTGAGIPGIPLKIVQPAMRLSLLESNQKRCRFLRDVVACLALQETEVLEGRAETWAREEAHREGYDLALARAVAPLPVLLEYALPFLRVGGWLAAPKGSAAPREVRDSGLALRELGGEISYSGSFRPPFGPAQTLILVRKVHPTPGRYPRRAGIPSKRPLA